MLLGATDAIQTSAVLGTLLRDESNSFSYETQLGV